MKVLIAGGLGYLGSVLAPFLRKDGHEVVVVDIGFFRECKIREHEDGHVHLKDAMEIDESLLDGVSAVVHLAGISNDPFGNLSPEKIYDPTRRYAIRLAEFCKKKGIRFIFASSCSIYGAGGEGVHDEESKTNPQTPYSWNKLYIEEDLKRLADDSFHPIMLRFATVYGFSPRMRFDLFVNMFAAMAVVDKKIVLNSNGQAWRPSLYIKDCIRSIAYFLEYPLKSPLVVNVGLDEDNLKVIDVANLVASCVPGCEVSFAGKDLDPLVKDRKIQDGVDTRTYLVSFKKLKELGFSCKYPLKEGIAELVSDLSSLPLTRELFKDAKFYRLQTMEKHFKSGLFQGYS